MRYDFVNLNALRYPFCDECLVDILHVFAISDESGYVEKLACAINRGDLRVDLFNRNKEIDGLFRSFLPDVLIINVDDYGSGRFADFSTGLKSDNITMPFLIVISNRRSEEIDEVCTFYRGVYHISAPFNLSAESEIIHDFLMKKVVSPDLYREKLRKCSALTLQAMRCNPNSNGFLFLTDAVCAVMEKPYFRFNYSRDIYPSIASRYNVKSKVVENAIRSEVASAILDLSEAELKIAFDGYSFEENQKPSISEFIQSAAYLTSRPCKKILRYLDDDPFIFRQA